MDVSYSSAIVIGLVMGTWPKLDQSDSAPGYLFKLFPTKQKREKGEVWELEDAF